MDPSPTIEHEQLGEADGGGADAPSAPGGIVPDRWKRRIRYQRGADGHAPILTLDVSLPSVQPIRTPQLILLALLMTYVLVVFRTAWVADDALLTIRSVLNFVNGYGPVFNIGERVQSYTHPLWFALLIVAQYLIPDTYDLLIALSMVCVSFAFFLLLFRIGVALAWTVLAAASLILSKAFVDYSSSGLENPLAYLCIALFVLVANRLTPDDTRRLTTLFLIFSAIALTRLDLILIVLPALIWACRSAGNARSVVQSAALGLSPLVLWTLFSLLYYGMLIPNTALAKLNIADSREEQVIRGVRYFFDSLHRDPVTLLVIFAALLLGLVVGRRPLRMALCGGILLYLGYVLSIGGDFMSGRFLAVPLFVAACVLAMVEHRGLVLPLLGLLAVLYLGLVQRPDFVTGMRADFASDQRSANGLVDERAFYFPILGRLNQHHPGYRRASWPRRAVDGSTVASVQVGVNGQKGLLAGPLVHLIDDYALSDPLLARIRAEAGQRIGHFARPIPEGYEQSVLGPENRIANPYLRQLYDKIRIVTRGDLFSRERLATIVNLNLGRYDDLAEQHMLHELAEEGAPWTDRGNLRIEPEATVRYRPPLTQVKHVDISVDGNDGYALDFVLEGRVLGSVTIEAQDKPGMTRLRLDLPDAVAASGFDAVTIRGLSGDGLYAVGHLRFE